MQILKTYTSSLSGKEINSEKITKQSLKPIRRVKCGRAEACRDFNQCC